MRSPTTDASRYHTAVVVLLMGLPIGAGLYLAWVHRDWMAVTRYRGLAAALTGTLLGAWFEFSAVARLAAVGTTIIGSTIIGNLALIVYDIVTELRSDHPDDRLIDLTTEDRALASI